MIVKHETFCSVLLMFHVFTSANDGTLWDHFKIITSYSIAIICRLEIRQVGEGIHHVPGLVEAHVNNMSEVWEVSAN